MANEEFNTELTLDGAVTRVNDQYLNIQALSPQVDLDPQPIPGHIDRAVTSDGVYTALLGKLAVLLYDDMPSSGSNKIVVSGAVFDADRGMNPQYRGVLPLHQQADPEHGVPEMDILGVPYRILTGNEFKLLKHNGIYVIWDNDIEEDTLVISPDTMPEMYATAEIHVFNHGDPINIVWPSNWRWYCEENDEQDFKADIPGGTKYSPTQVANTAMCIKVRTSVDYHTLYTPNLRVVPCVLAKVEYVYSWHP